MEPDELTEILAANPHLKIIGGATHIPCRTGGVPDKPPPGISDLERVYGTNISRPLVRCNNANCSDISCRHGVTHQEGQDCYIDCRDGGSCIANIATTAGTADTDVVRSPGSEIGAADLLEWWKQATSEQRDRMLADNPWMREEPRFANSISRQAERERLPRKPRRHEEDKLIADIIKAAHLHGWLAYHQRPGRTRQGWATPIQGDSGSPDLLLVHSKRGKFILAECKSNEGRLSAHQKVWRDCIRQSLAKAWYRDPVVEYYIWKPVDWPEIIKILEGR